MRNSIEVYTNGRVPTAWSLMDQFDEMFERAFQNPWSLMGDMRPIERELFQPHMDLEENESAYLMTIDLPGVKKEDVQVNLNGNILTVSGERKRMETVTDKNGTRKEERAYGKFQRSFTLPETVNAEKIEANLENGVLSLALPKAEAAKPRTIQIQTGKSGFFSKLLGSRDERQEKDVSHSATSQKPQ